MKLTPRQQAVFDLAVQGYTNGEIADRLYLTERTVKTHMTHVYERVGLATVAGSRAKRARLISLARRAEIAADLPRYDPRTEVVVPRAVWEQLQRLVSLVEEAA